MIRVNFTYPNCILLIWPAVGRGKDPTFLFYSRGCGEGINFKTNSFVLGSNCNNFERTYKGVSKSFQTCCLERELQTVQLSATECNYIAIL